jgi:hypothetical protein
MAIVSITLEDVVINDVDQVNFKLKLESIGEDEGATKAMLVAHEFRNLFQSNKIDLNKVMARLKGEVAVAEAVRQAAQFGG